MSFIGEAAVSTLLEVLTGKLIESAVKYVSDHKQVKQQLVQWQSKLGDIQAVLNDAEEKQIKHTGVKNWLNDLQDLAYDVDDILDELAYEELRLKLQNTQPSKIRKLIPTCCSCTSFLFNDSMIAKINKVTDRLNDLTARRTILGLNEILSKASSLKGKHPRPLQPTSVVDETVEYVGRQDEKQEMLDLLRSSNNSSEVSVLSIVGMGGMGKTTLAQLVYNDAESFHYKAWVCVSDDFDAVKITNTILKSIDHDSRDETDLNLLQVKLKEKLYGKKFLLVLDDVWNESYNDWTILRSPFGAGTAIIVTTRLQKVSSNVDPVKAFHLDKLSHVDCSSIFTQHAFKARNFDGYPQLKEVGEKIVRRCDGLPLAAKAIGSLLRRVEDKGEWERIYESEIWDLPEDQCGIVPALRLSYHHLPSHLKRCFAYCSIIPKDYVFEEEEIILLWRAEGFLQQKDKRQIKDVGKEYFQDLVSRSFFQAFGIDKSWFRMHDLINDLAQLAAGEICSKLEDDKQQMFSNRTRHSSYFASKYDTVKKFQAFDQANSLRTFLPFRSRFWDHFYLTNFVLVDLLPRLCYLRVLSLSGYHITELPDDVFENLKHLRYLNFSDTKIKWLPESLCTLYHLETLILRNCMSLEKLPLKMENLVNLHYLDIRGADLVQRTPFGIGELRNLEILSKLECSSSVAEEDFCLGTVSLSNISKFSVPAERTMSRSETFGTDDLNESETLSQNGFSLVGDRSLSIKDWEEEELQLDSSLPGVESLDIRNCERLTKLPKVLHAFTFFTEMILEKCPGLVCVAESNFPPALKKLVIKRCENLQYLVDEKEDDNKSICSNTSLLEHLEIYDCDSLICLSSRADKCNRLLHLDVQYCSQLSSLFSNAKLPAMLKHLEIRECPMLECIARDFRETTDLEFIEIRAEKLQSLPRGLDKLSHLQEIEITNCSNLVSFEESGLLDFPATNLLRVFSINNCSNFGALPKFISNFTSLQTLRIHRCSADISFPEDGLPTNLTSLGIFSAPKLYTSLVQWGFSRLTSLQYLQIGGEGCSNVVSFPEQGIGLTLPPSLTQIYIENFENLKCMSSKGFQHLPSLQKLSICWCPKLTSLPEKDVLLSLHELFIVDCPLLEEGREWSKISYIPSVQIDFKQVIPRGLDWFELVE